MEGTKKREKKQKIIQENKLRADLHVNQSIQSEREMESERFLKAVLAASPIGMCRLRNGLFDLVNESMCNITGYTFEDFAGRDPRFLCNGEDEFKNMNRILNTDGRYEGKYRKKDGTLVDVALGFAPIDNVSHILTVMDMRNRQDVPKESVRISKLESIGVLAGAMAHDFNNILTAILGNVSLAKIHMPRDQEKALEKLIKVDDAIGKAKTLTQHLLALSKGNLSARKKVHIGDYLKKVCHHILVDTPVTCTFNFPPDLVLVEIDEEQMNQAVGHILINGRQAMPDGGVIAVEGENVSADKTNENRQAGAFVRVTFSDHGPGIPDDIVDKIFNPFFTTKETGSGLGLAVCHSVMKNHKGYVTVQSAPGEGASFSLYIPVYEGD